MKKPSRSLLLLGAFSISVLFLIFFFMSHTNYSTTSLIEETANNNNDHLHHQKSIENSDSDEKHDGTTPQKEQQNHEVVVSRSKRISSSLKSTILQKLTKCVPATKQSPIAKAAAQANLASRLETLCSTHCKKVDKNKLPSSSSSADVESSWRPEFCTMNKKKSSNHQEQQVRYDHGCFESPPLKEDDNDGIAEKAHKNNDDNDDADCRDENDNNDDDDDHPSSVTAIFTAISNSSVGARFFGGCQEYVWESIRQWRLFHPSLSLSRSCSSKENNNNKKIAAKKNPIFLITSAELFMNPLVRANASHFDVTLINFETELVNEDWRRYERVFYVQGYMHPCGSRQTGNKDFNKLVSARFFAIEALMRKRNLKHVVCLENDMMVYTNFDSTVRAVQNCGWRMASMFPHFKGVIPGLMYVRSSNDILRLSHFINDLLSCGKKFGKALTPGYANDMTYMLNFYQLFGAQWMGDLPNFPASSSSSSSAGGGENCVADQLPNLLHDGASFGQWYSFAVKNNPVIKELKALPASVDDECVGSSEDNKNNNGQSSSFFKTSGCFSWEKKLADHVKQTKDGSPISSMKPPLHIQNAMKGRFVDATPGELVRWRIDGKGRRVPYWGKYQLSSLHIHAKNLWWFRSK